MVLFSCRVGAGTAHGFGLIDYVQKIEVTSRCTLNPEGTDKFLIIGAKNMLHP